MRYNLYMQTIYSWNTKQTIDLSVASHYNKENVIKIHNNFKCVCRQKCYRKCEHQNKCLVSCVSGLAVGVDANVSVMVLYVAQATLENVSQSFTLLNTVNVCHVHIHFIVSLSFWLVCSQRSELICVSSKLNSDLYWRFRFKAKKERITNKRLKK